jgi:DNA-binding transcriptional ArsR family regulator
MTQEEVVQTQQPQEEFAKSQEESVQEVKQTPQQEGSREEFVDMFSQIFGIPKDIVAKALNKEESLQRAQALVQLMHQLSQLPKEMRKALAPLVAGMVSSDDDVELKKLARWIAIMRALNDPVSRLFIQLLVEERKRVYELQKQLIQLIMERYASNGAHKEEVVQKLVQQVAKDPLDGLVERLEKLQKVAQILGFQRLTEEKPKSIFDAIEEISKLADVLRKFGFDVKPAIVEQELRRIKEEAYREGLKEGVRKAEQFAELAKTALEKLGPSLSKLMDALADYLKTKQQQATA